MTNYTAKTFFLVLWDKSISNMGIQPNWDNLEQLKGNLEGAIGDISQNYYGAICKSAQGAYHVHLAISFDKAKRVKAVAETLGNAHVEPMRGTKEQATKYIDKEPPYDEKGEVVLLKFGERTKITDNSGLRVDIDAIRQDIRDGKVTASTIDEYILEHAKTEAQARMIESTYTRVMQANGMKQRDVKVIYVEGATGSGKTRGAYDRYSDIFKASVSNKTSFPFNGYRGQKVLLLDELRQGVFTPAELFQILDRYPLQVDVKGGRFPALWDTVIITTAMPLESWFTREDKGQDNNKQQLLRRITEHMKAEDGKWRPYDRTRDEFHEVDIETPFT